MDRTAIASKSKGGGVCFMINKKCCDPRNTSTLSRSCSLHLEHLSIIVTTVYIPPQANTGLALSKLHDVLSGYIKNTLTLPLSSRGTLTKPTLGRLCRTFINMYPVQLEDHCYSQFKNAYKAHYLPAFVKSNHAIIFLTPEYKKRLTNAYNEALLYGNMSEYKASCYALRCAVRTAKLRYRERIESQFQLNESRCMWQALRTICAFGNKSSAEVRADPLFVFFFSYFVLIFFSYLY